MHPIGLLDGKIVDLKDPIIAMEDRGYQFGDGVYEVTRVYNGCCFTLKQHMDRLYRSLRELRIPAVYTFDELQGFHEQLIKESSITEAIIYLQITRGAASRAHHFPERTLPCLTMSIRPTSPPLEMQEKGAKVLLTPDERWLRCDIKSINLLGNVLSKQLAKEAGCFEALQVRDGIVTEGTSTNFFVVKDGVLWTHPVSNLILKGITRTLIIEKVAPQLGLPVIEKPFAPDFLQTVDEAFICATNSEIVPVISIGQQPIGKGIVGSVCRQLHLVYQKIIDSGCKRK